MQPTTLYHPKYGCNFGDLGRDEINKVMAGISWSLPTTPPFDTGLVKTPRQSSKTPNVASYATSSPTESSPTEPLPMEPLLTEPLSTEPLPTDPSATDPSATESLPSIPPTNGTENSVTISAETTIASTNSGLTIETNGDASPSSTLPTAPQTSKPKPSTWAALFKPGTSPNAAGHANAISPTASKSQTASKSAKPPSLNGAPEFTGIADILNNYETSFQSSLFQPRGLVNNGNICFMNAILQPLSHCPPFYNLVTKIGNRVAHNFKSKTPLLDSFIEFLNEFKIVNESTDFEEYGKPLLPEYVYNALRKRFDSMRGRQEDAEEALGFLLDGLHEEFISVQKKKTEKYVIENIAYEYAQEDNDSAVINGGDAVLEGQNGWLEVGPKNKTSAMRTTEVMESPISRIFGGKVRSVLKCPGTMDSVTLDPFQSFQLDIQPENVHTIEDALANMTVPEMMHDYVSPKGIKVEATKQIRVETLPPILVLHLKRFLYDNVGGVQKLHKHVSYSTELTIRQEWVSRRTPKPITYKLFGVVYHHGKSALGGHYTCDVRRQNNQWLHIDDTNITPVNESDVAVVADRHGHTVHPVTDRLAYLLFFMQTS